LKRKYISNKIRALLLKEINLKCPFCNSEDVQHFQVHHIDGNCSNNDCGNFIIICPTCHSKIEKGDIITARVKEVKASLTKTKAKLSAIELAELEQLKVNRERKKYEYMHSNEVRTDMINEWNILSQIVQEKCDSIKKVASINISKTSEGHVKVSLNRIYILIQFYPQFVEYHLSCTFNEYENIYSRSKGRDKFIIERFLFDIDDNCHLGWNDGNKFYTSEDIAEYLLQELVKVNSDFR
jgi:hypothetical protein